MAHTDTRGNASFPVGGKLGAGEEGTCRCGKSQTQSGIRSEDDSGNSGRTGKTQERLGRQRSQVSVTIIEMCFLL